MQYAVCFYIIGNVLLAQWLNFVVNNPESALGGYYSVDWTIQLEYWTRLDWTTGLDYWTLGFYTFCGYFCYVFANQMPLALCKSSI